MQEMQVGSLGRENPLVKEMATHSRILTGNSHEHRSLAGYSPWSHKELDTTEQLSTDTHTHTHTINTVLIVSDEQ